MTLRSLHRAVLTFGLVGSFLFVLAGVWVLLSRVWSMSITQTLEVAVAAPFLAAWVLAPIVWIARPRRVEEADEIDEKASFITLALVVGVGAGAYLYEFVLMPVAFDRELRLSSLLVVLIVPAVQWTVLGVSGVVEWARSRGGGEE